MVYRKCISMIQNIGSVSMFNRMLFCIVVLVCCYPYSICGDPYESADHYWPMCNITNNFLEDKQGAAHTIVYGAKTVPVPQLGHALSLDGKDDWVDTGGFNGDCVTEPSSCQDGFTVTFWLKVYSTGYIMSSGSFTNHRNGPGFQLYYHQSLKRFKFLLETRDKRWTLLIHEEIGLWTHMAFTWHIQNGLRYYEDGNLSTFTEKPEFVSPLRQQNYTPVITLARPNELSRMNREYGKFDISQLAIWVKQLSAEDVAGVYDRGVTYDSHTILCCHFKRGELSPCVTNPCHDVDECRRISESPQDKCICPAVNLRLKTCTENITGECEDKSSGCREFAAQSAYCKHRKMRKICPRSCNYCAPQRPSTTLQPTLSTGSISMSRLVRESKDPVTLTSSSSPPLSPHTSKSTMITHGTIHRRRPRGPSCEVLQCQPYEQCVQTDNGYAECRCQEECKTQRRPVCGTNDKTYLNMCVLELEACRSGTLIRRKHHDVCGIRFKLAAHYLPMNGTTSDKKLVDMRGNASAQAYNGVKTSTAEQLGEFLTLDGTDGVIELKNFEDRCIVDPTECMEGLSVAFWIRYAKGEFIISSGEYTSKNSGPGFRFICKNCTKNSSHAQSSRKFILELSTSQAKWEIHLDSIPCWWFHFAFTWSRNRGLKFYENGRLAVSSGDSIEVSSSGNHKKSFITIGKPNSLQSLMNSHGNLSIGHLVIWTHELTAFDMEVAFLTVPTKTTKSLTCCEQMKGDPCVEKPYHDGHSCHGMADKHKCICTDSFNRVCSLKQKLAEECEDKTPQCQLLAKQENYCEHHRRRMKEQCPSACDFCGILTQVPGFSSTSMQLPLKVSSTFTSPSAVPILTTTVRPTIAQISTTLVSSTSTTRASSSFATSSVARMSTSLTNSAVARVSSLPASSSTVKINTKSTSSTPHVLFSRATTTSSLAQITSVQPMLSSSVPTQKKDTLRCKINNSTCICFNCEEALKNGKICCIDQIDNKNIQHGVTMNVTNITVKDFYSKVEAVSRIIGEVVRDSCRENASPCVTGKRFSHTRGKRRRRSPEENILKNYPSFDVVRTKREALSPDETPSMTNISHVDVIICGISSKAGHPSNVQTDFYVTVTSLNNGTNQTAVIDGKGLLQILRDNKRTLEDKLNITIDSFAASQKPEKRATTTSPHRTLVPNPSSGSPNMQSPSSSLEVAAVPTTAVDGRSVEDGKKQGISQGLLILIICVGCAGVVLMIVVMAFILTRFYKQRKGEFVPDKSYPNSHNKQNGNVSMEDAETYSTSIIDPSTPRITDVPHKPTRAQAAWGGAGGAKKQKKPMGVKVTYKPPEWD